MLTAAQIEARRGKMTGSRIKELMTSNIEGIMRMYREFTDTATPEDIKHWEGVSASRQVQMGEFTEKLNLNWHEEDHKCQVWRRGEVKTYHGNPRFACTLDGFVYADEPYVVEAKHCGGFEKDEAVIERYQPQCQWNMFVTATRKCALSIIFGNASRFETFWIDRDDEYVSEEIKRATHFLKCVDRRHPPVALPPVEPPVIPTRTVSMQGNNQWANDAWLWASTKKEADRHKEAAEALKKMVPPDVKEAVGHGIKIVANKAGAKTIKEVA